MLCNEDLAIQHNDAIPRGLAVANSFYVDKALNAELWDVEGNRFIDFTGGIGVLNTGHCHPRIIDAVKHQLDRFTHTAAQVVCYESYIQLAQRLNAIVPIENARSVLFSTGAEAVENSVKIARAFTSRSSVVTFRSGYHGRSMYTLGMTGKISPYKKMFGPYPGDIFHTLFPMPKLGVSEQDCINYLKLLFESAVEPERVAAIVIEPVLGDGGFYITPNEFMNHLRIICDEHGILLICDEVQSGFARTGCMFAMDHYDVQPDMIIMAKSLAGGFPISAVSGREEVMQAPAGGGLGGTYAGSPIGCAAALAVLDVIEEENLCEKANEIGEIIKLRLSKVDQHQQVNYIGDIRSLGAMIAFEIVKDKNSMQADAALASMIAKKCAEKGLIILTSGLLGNSLRILVPLTISTDTLNEALAILEETLLELALEHSV